MIIVMKLSASAADTKQVVDRIHTLGLEEHLSQGETQTIIGVVGDTQRIDRTGFEVLPGVERTVRITQPFKLASREFSPAPTVIEVRGVKVGGETYRCHGRPLLGRVPRPDIGNCLCRQRSGCSIPAGRRFQTPFLALCLPGNGKRGS